MEIKLLAFGISKDILGSREFQFTLDGECSVGQLKKQLLKQYPAFEDLRSLAIAVNNNYAEDHLILKSGDEIALIPPVSGG